MCVAGVVSILGDTLYY